MTKKSYKFRLYPNEEQKEMFAKTFGCTRAIWNMMLADKNKHYKKTGELLNNTPVHEYQEFLSFLKLYKKPKNAPYYL